MKMLNQFVLRIGGFEPGIVPFHDFLPIKECEFPKSPESETFDLKMQEIASRWADSSAWGSRQEVQVENYGLREKRWSPVIWN
jgi:hypothetical protein